MIGRLGVYGSSENLPFLYSQVSNVEYGVRAVRSILRIEGITSNSLAMVRNGGQFGRVSDRPIGAA